MSRLPLPLLVLTLGCNPVDAFHDFVAARPKELSLPTPLPPPASLSGGGQAKDATSVAPLNPIVQPLAPPATSVPSAVAPEAPTKAAVVVVDPKAIPPTPTPNPAPEASPPPTAPASKVSHVRVHVLRRGETMTAVARRYGVPFGGLLVANDYTWDDIPVAGTRIHLTTISDGSWTVRRHQHLSEIAETLGTSATALAAANDITNPDEIYAGQVLALPTR